MYMPLPDDGFIALPGTFAPKDVRGANPSLWSLTMFHGVVQRLYLGAGVKYYAGNLMIAYNAARSARFEHGEAPA
jgi:hypothetical protein